MPGAAGAPRWTAVLLDLDGTIVDSAPGITATLAWTFERLGMPIPSPSDMLAWVGPPLLDAFRELGGLPEDEARAALAVYRGRYREVGVYDAAVYPGVADLIRDLHAAGLPTSLATSKPESLARGRSRYLNERCRGDALAPMKRCVANKPHNVGIAARQPQGMGHADGFG